MVLVSPVLIFISVTLVFFWAFGEVVVETAVDLAKWNGEINLPPATGETDPASCKPGSSSAAGQSFVLPSRLLLKMCLL